MASEKFRLADELAHQRLALRRVNFNCPVEETPREFSRRPAVPASQGGFGKTQVRFEYEGRLLVGQLDRLREVLPENVWPPAAGHRHHAKKSARLAQLSVETVLDRQRTSMFCRFLRRDEVPLIPLHQAAREHCLRPLRRGCRLRSLRSDGLLEQRDS